MNGGTWAVITLIGGREHTSGGYGEAGAAEMAHVTLPAELGIDDAFTRDLLPGLEAKFPPGAPVWLGTPVHWRLGQHGIVTPGVPERHACWLPDGDLVPWFISTDGASVHVLLDDGYESWWPACWLETR
jgi:hypothetical protein